MQLTVANVAVYALGCATAGSGGGSTKIPLAMAVRAVDELGPVDIADVSSLGPDGIIMPVGTVSTPVVATERVWSGEKAFILREQVGTRCKAPVVGLMCYEIGARTAGCRSLGLAASACRCLTPTAWAAPFPGCNNGRCT